MDDHEYDIIYKSGKNNTNADALSRIETVLPDSTKINNMLVVTRAQAKNTSSNIDNTTTTTDKIDSDSSALHKSSPVIPHENESQSTSFSGKVELSDERDIKRVLDEYHNSSLGGHQGIIKTLQRIKNYYYFPQMLSRIRKYIQSCEKCQKNKVCRINKAPMKITSTSKRPFQKIFMDIVGPLPESYNQNKYIFTTQDDLTKYSLAVPLKNQETATISKAFTIHFICQFGAPESIVTDQGSNFMSEMFKHTCKLLTIKKFNTTAYHPQSNGALERSHRTLAEYNRNFSNGDQLNWDEWVPFAMFAYNSSPHSTTNVMPYELVFGHKPLLPR